MVMSKDSVGMEMGREEKEGREAWWICVCV